MLRFHCQLVRVYCHVIIHTYTLSLAGRYRLSMDLVGLARVAIVDCIDERALCDSQGIHINEWPVFKAYHRGNKEGKTPETLFDPNVSPSHVALPLIGKVRPLQAQLTPVLTSRPRCSRSLLPTSSETMRSASRPRILTTRRLRARRRSPSRRRPCQSTSTRRPSPSSRSSRPLSRTDPRRLAAGDPLSTSLAQ